MALPLTRERTIRSVLSISLCLSNYVLAHITLCGEMVPLLYAFRHGRRDMLEGLPASSDWHLSQGNRGSQMVDLQRYRLHAVLEAHTLGGVVNQHVGEPTPLSLSTTGMYSEVNWALARTIQTWILLCHRGEVLRDPTTGCLFLLFGWLCLVCFACFLTSSFLRIYLLSNS